MSKFCKNSRRVKYHTEMSASHCTEECTFDSSQCHITVSPSTPRYTPGLVSLIDPICSYEKPMKNTFTTTTYFFSF